MFEFMKGRHDIVSTHIDDGLVELRDFSLSMTKALEATMPNKTKIQMDKPKPQSSSSARGLFASQQLFHDYTQFNLLTLEGVRNKTVVPLKDFYDKQSAVKKKIDKDVKRQIEKLAGYNKDLAREKTLCEKSLLTCKQKASDPKIVKTAQKTFKSYEETHARAVELNAELNNKMFPSALRQFEDMEQARLKIVADCLADFAECFRKMQTDVKNGMSGVDSPEFHIQPHEQLKTTVDTWLSTYGMSPPPEPIFYELPCRGADLEKGEWDTETAKTAKARKEYEEAVEEALLALVLAEPPPPPEPPSAESAFVAAFLSVGIVTDVSVDKVGDAAVPRPPPTPMTPVTPLTPFNSTGNGEPEEEEDNEPVPPIEISEAELEGLSEKEKKTLRTRNNLAMEVLTTEESYVKALRDAQVLYSRPIKQKLQNKDESSPFTDAQHALFFSNLDIIHNLNSKFLKDLKVTLRTWNSQGCMGKNFLTMGHFFKMYINYITNLEQAQKLMQTMSKDVKWTDFQNVVIADGGRPLNDLIVTPMQRIPRYKMLVAELLKNTPEGHPDFADLTKALELVNTVALTINKQVAESDSRMRMKELAEMFVPADAILAPSRKFVRQGKLFKKSRRKDIEYEFFLFSDMLAYASTQPAGSKYKMHNKLDFDTVFTIQKGDKESEITLESSTKSFVAFASDAATATSWYNDISEALQKHRQVIETRDKAQGSTMAKAATPNQPAGRAVWKQDKEASDCVICHRGWTTLRRRHHCRKCGLLVCGTCSQSKIVLSLSKGKERVCDNCKTEAQSLDDKVSFCPGTEEGPPSSNVDVASLSSMEPSQQPQPSAFKALGDGDGEGPDSDDDRAPTNDGGPMSPSSRLPEASESTPISKPNSDAEDDGDGDEGDDGYESGKDYDELGPFPPGWVVYETDDPDPAKRKPYYFHHETDVTVWKRPMA